jgi:solute carrier family 45 protein 1/2/4
VISQSQKRPGHCGYPNACADLQLATLLLVLTINVSATSLQMGLRALMVDVCSDCQQSEVNAWMARLTNASNVFFYLSAYIDLPKLLGWAGQTQLQILTKLSAILIATTQSITCWYARHESRFSAPSIGESLPLENLDSKYWWNSNNNILSRRLWVIQGVQFLSWFAWFPFLAYIGR